MNDTKPTKVKDRKPDLKDKKLDNMESSNKYNYYRKYIVYSLNMMTDNTTVHSIDLVKLTAKKGSEMKFLLSTIYQELYTARSVMVLCDKVKEYCNDNQCFNKIVLHLYMTEVLSETVKVSVKNL